MMFNPIHLNARADECSAAVMERGHRIVQYRGEGYIMVGFYFARGNNGQRDLYYILRPSDGDSTTGIAVISRRRDHQEKVTSG